MDTALQEHVCIKENGYSYLWEKSDVVCSCSTLVEDLNEMISEAKEDGTYERKKADLEMERWKAYHFISIAIGEKGHFKSYNW